MPLQAGSSKETISKNIGAEVNASKPPAQAAAIAFHKAGEDAYDFGGANDSDDYGEEPEDGLPYTYGEPSGPDASADLYELQTEGTAPAPTEENWTMPIDSGAAGASFQSKDEDEQKLVDGDEEMLDASEEEMDGELGAGENPPKTEPPENDPSANPEQWGMHGGVIEDPEQEDMGVKPQSIEGMTTNVP